jgi:hypothetical protein
MIPMFRWFRKIRWFLLILKIHSFPLSQMILKILRYRWILRFHSFR